MSSKDIEDNSSNSPSKSSEPSKLTMKTDVSDEIMVELYLNGVFNKLEQSNIQLQQNCQKLRDKKNFGNLAVQTPEMKTKTITEPEVNKTEVQSVEIQTDAIPTEINEDKIQSTESNTKNEHKIPELITKATETEVQTNFKTIEMKSKSVAIQTNESELQMFSMNEDLTILPNQSIYLTLQTNTSTKVNNTDWIEIKPVNNNLFIMSEQPLKLNFTLAYLNTTVEVFNASSSNCLVKKNQVFGNILPKKVLVKIEENKVMKLTFPDGTISSFMPSICQSRSENSWILSPNLNLDPKCIHQVIYQKLGFSKKVNFVAETLDEVRMTYDVLLPNRDTDISIPFQCYFYHQSTPILDPESGPNVLSKFVFSGNHQNTPILNPDPSVLSKNMFSAIWIEFKMLTETNEMKNATFWMANEIHARWEDETYYFKMPIHSSGDFIETEKNGLWGLVKFLNGLPCQGNFPKKFPIFFLNNFFTIIFHFFLR